VPILLGCAWGRVVGLIIGVLSEWINSKLWLVPSWKRCYILIIWELWNRRTEFCQLSNDVKFNEQWIKCTIWKVSVTVKWLFVSTSYEQAHSTLT
jgi:hypothetical protein